MRDSNDIIPHVFKVEFVNYARKFKSPVGMLPVVFVFFFHAEEAPADEEVRLGRCQRSGS